jgi:hypothetical protein
MRFKFETKRQGRCFAESDHDDDSIRVEIWDGDEFEMHCSRITARWACTLYNKLGG